MKQIDWVVISINVQKKAGWGRANGAGPWDELQMKLEGPEMWRGPPLCQLHSWGRPEIFNCEWEQSSF